MITKEDIQENTHLLPETFTGTFTSNKGLMRNRYGRAAIPRWNVALKNGKTMSLSQTLVAGMRSKNRTLKECKDLVKEATDKNDKDALVGLFDIVKREQPPVYDQIASKFALCRSLSGLRTSWWCNGLVSKILKRVDDLEDDIFCPAEIQKKNAKWASSAHARHISTVYPLTYRENRLLESRKQTKRTLDSLEKQMDIKVFENFQRLYNAFASAQKEALSSRVGGKFKVKVQPRDSAEDLVHCTLELDNQSLVVSGKDGKIVARIHDDGFAVVRNKPKYIDFLSKLNDDDDEGSFLNYVFQNVCSCVFCGRNLTVGTSIAQGAGDICYGRYGTRWKQTMAEENGNTDKPVYTPGCFVDHLATQEVRDAAGRTATLPTILCIASPVIRMFAEDNEDQNTEVLEYLEGTFTEDQLKTLAYYMETWLVYPFNVFGKKEPEYKFYGLEYASMYGMRRDKPSYHRMPLEPDNEIQEELLQHLIQHPRQASQASFGFKREGFVLGYMMMNMDMLRLIDYLDIPFVRDHILFQMKPLYHASMLEEYLDGNSSEIEIQLQEKKKIDKNAPKKPKSAYKLFQTTKETDVQKKVYMTLKKKYLEENGCVDDTQYELESRLMYTDKDGKYQFGGRRRSYVDYMYRPIPGTVFAEWYAKELPVYWKSLSDEEKKPFVDMAAEDKSRYDTEMEAYESPSTEGKSA
jgi:hypothetical protein